MKSRIRFKLAASLCLASTALAPVAVSASDTLYPMTFVLPANHALADGDGHKGNGTGLKILLCVGGGLLGGLIGGKKLGLVFGAALCAAGWALGGKLTKHDKTALTDHSKEILAQNDTAKTEVWSAPDSHEQVQLEVTAPEVQTQQVEFVTDQGITDPPAGTRVHNESYVVLSERLNFRTEPSIASPTTIRGYFVRDENVEVLGVTADGKWALVGDNGVVVGYASMTVGGQPSMATPDTAEQIRAEEARAAKTKAAKLAAARAAAKVAAARHAARAKPRIVQNASDTDGTLRPDGTATRTVAVSAQTQCKVLTATLGTRSQKRTGCALPNGQWALT